MRTVGMPSTSSYARITVGAAGSPTCSTSGSSRDRQGVAKSPVANSPAPDYENGWNAINQLIREDYSWCGREPNVFYKRIQPRSARCSEIPGGQQPRTGL